MRDLDEVARSRFLKRTTSTLQKQAIRENGILQPNWANGGIAKLQDE
jgi:hypothetical protein